MLRLTPSGGRDCAKDRHSARRFGHRGKRHKVSPPDEPRFQLGTSHELMVPRRADADGRVVTLGPHTANEIGSLGYDTTFRSVASRPLGGIASDRHQWCIWAEPTRSTDI